MTSLRASNCSAPGVLWSILPHLFSQVFHHTSLNDAALFDRYSSVADCLGRCGATAAVRSHRDRIFTTTTCAEAPKTKEAVYTVGLVDLASKDTAKKQHASLVYCGTEGPTEDLFRSI